jgi:hypothetical protein
MNPLLLPAAIMLLAFAGCADPIEHRSTQEVQEQVAGGITGHGTLVPLERRAGDPAAEHSVSETHQ